MQITWYVRGLTVLSSSTADIYKRMAKFGNSSDAGYKRILGELNRWLKQIKAQEGQDMFVVTGMNNCN